MPSHLIMIDVESDGPAPGLYNMVCFGAVSVRDPTQTFFGKTKPIVDRCIPEALAISGYSRVQHELFPDPQITMLEFKEWIKTLVGEERPLMISDNPAFDFQFINYYFHAFVGSSPFGHSARRIGDIWSGLTKKISDHSSWKNRRITRHTHHPVDDCQGNVEALLSFKQLGLR